MKSTSLAAFALTLSSALAIPPDNFGFPSSTNGTPLSVVYQANGTALPLQPGGLFGIDVPAEAPTIAVNESYNSLGRSYNGQYFLLMVDPDASYPENPTNRFIIHWWQQNLTKSTTRVNDLTIGGTLLVNNTAPRVAYRRPRPPTNSSAHRYIQYLFEQPNNFQIPAAYSGYNTTNSTRFPLQQFLAAAALSNPVAANYFYCSNQTIVPPNFVANPGQQYPGGNGAMVTQGQNLPSSTAAATASATGGAASSATSSSTSSATGSAPAPSVSAYTGASSRTSTGNSALYFAVAVGAMLASHC